MELSTDDPSDIDSFMAAVRSVESGGDYSAVGPSTRYGRATGAYQFLDSTWGGYGGYRRAADAPPSVQDARARELMGSYFQKFGSWPAVAVAWHAGPGAAARFVSGELDISGIGDVNVSTRTYVDRVIDGFTAGDGSGSGSAMGTSSIETLTAVLRDTGFWARVGRGLLGIAAIAGGVLIVARDALPIGKVVDVAGAI